MPISRNMLFLVIGALIVAVAALGYKVYDDHRQPKGVQLSIGPRPLLLKGRTSLPVPPRNPGDRMTDTHTNDAAKDQVKTKANAAFRKEQQAREGAIAMTEYVAEQKHVRSNMEKLRELRLAKEAEEAKAAANEAVEAKPKKKRAAKRIVS